MLLVRCLTLNHMKQTVFMCLLCGREFGLNDSFTVKSKVFIHLAESAKCRFFLPSKRDHTNACFCLFSTDLNKIFHIKYVYK